MVHRLVDGGQSAARVVLMGDSMRKACLLKKSAALATCFGLVLGSSLGPAVTSSALAQSLILQASANQQPPAVAATDIQCPAPPSSDQGPVAVSATRMAPTAQRPSRVVGVPPPPPPPPPPAPPSPMQPAPTSDAVRIPEPIIATAERVVDQTWVEPRTDTERYPDAAVNPVRRVAEQPVSTFAMETDTAAYANARSFITGGSRLPPVASVRVEEFLNYFRYDYPRGTDRSRPFETTVAVAPSPWSPQKQLVHIGLSGYDLEPAERPPLNLVLLVDVSGSMRAPNKLPLAQRALRILATRLTARDRVSMVVYAGAQRTILESVPGTNTRDIVCALEAVQGGGSTAGAQGISRAYELARNNRLPNGINRVILLTDGDFNVGISDPDRLKDLVREQARENDIYLSVFGFGMRDAGGADNYNDTMMQALAQNGNGTAAFIDTLSEARRVFDRDVSSTLFPIANDVKAQVEFNPARVAEWRLIGYETRALAREDFNNDAVDAGEIGSGHQVTALYEITPVGAPEVVDPLRYQPEARAGATEPMEGEEIAFLRLRYKLPGEATSRLIERPITQADVRRSIAGAPQDMRWAAAVAAFAQQLRNDPWISQTWTYGDTLALAQTAQGQDPYGDRAEFIALVERARTLQR